MFISHAAGPAGAFVRAPAGASSKPAAGDRRCRKTMTEVALDRTMRRANATVSRNK
jgi:hypothetical protein